MPAKDRYWVIIPAAGFGNRMGTDIPKQYLKIRGRCILEHTVSKFTRLSAIEGIVVVISKNDTYWSDLDLSGNEKLMTAVGGKERYHSVLNGLYRLGEVAGGNDWVLVHDAARPCVRMEDITNLIENLSGHPAGGLLGVPVRDTMKRADLNDEITGTISRERLWHALTPQMFRKQILIQAIENSIRNNIDITDEAQAMENEGFNPKLIAGHPDNIKITHKNDLPLAELFLKQQEQH